jgi:hypothetical protein
MVRWGVQCVERGLKTLPFRLQSAQNLLWGILTSSLSVFAFLSAVALSCLDAMMFSKRVATNVVGVQVIGWLLTALDLFGFNPKITA